MQTQLPAILMLERIPASRARGVKHSDGVREGGHKAEIGATD